MSELSKNRLKTHCKVTVVLVWPVCRAKTGFKWDTKKKFLGTVNCFSGHVILSSLYHELRGKIILEQGQCKWTLYKVYILHNEERLVNSGFGKTCEFLDKLMTGAHNSSTGCAAADG